MSLKFKKFVFQFSKARLTLLAWLIFSVDVGTNVYTNFQASDENFVKIRDEKLKANRESAEANRLLARGDTVAMISLKGSAQMIENNDLALNQIKQGKRAGAEMWSKTLNTALKTTALADTAYKNYLARADALVLAEYNRNVNRKDMTTITGGATGLAVGILTPIFSLFLMTVSVKPYDNLFKRRCIAGAHGAQFMSCVITAIGMQLMFGSWYLAIGFAIVLFWCAPLSYEAAARERQRLSDEFLTNQKSELEEMQKQLEAKQNAMRIEQEEGKRRQDRKALAEKSRMDNLLQTANRLVNKQKADPLAAIPTDPDKAAEWFVKNGEPYGLQIKIAEHCNEAKSSFSRRVEQKRLTLSTNGNGKVAEPTQS